MTFDFDKVSILLQFYKVIYSRCPSNLPKVTEQSNGKQWIQIVTMSQARPNYIQNNLYQRTFDGCQMRGGFGELDENGEGIKRYKLVVTK